MSDIHNNITEATHGGYAKSSNRIASIYYWPQMSREIKKYVGTCDICQKNHTEEATPHTATGFAPVYLLRGYVPVTGSSLIHSPENISRYSEASYSLTENDSPSPDASEMLEQFNAERQQAQEALLLGQYFKKRVYNKGRLYYEFEEGDLVLINPHSLSLLRSCILQSPTRSHGVLMDFA